MGGTKGFVASISTVFFGLLLVWAVINIFAPAFGLSTVAIWSFDGMKPLADPVKAVWNGVGTGVSRFVGTSPASAAPAAPAVPAGTATRVTLIKEYPEVDPADGCTYWVKAMSDGTFPKTMVSCPAVSPPAVPAPAAPATPAAPAPLAASAPCNSQRETHVPAVGQGWTPNGSWRIVNFWTNEPGKPQGERKLLLAPGQNPTLMGGGSSWSWPSGCEGTVKGEYASNGLPPVDLGQLQAEGLAR